MAELPNQKFKYKKDRLDWIMILIMIFTIACFIGIFYGMQYFNDRDIIRETDDRNQIDEMIQNRALLERQIREQIGETDYTQNN